MQLKISLSPELHEHLQLAAKKYGLTMSAYVKNLIIQDIKGDVRLVFQAPLPIDKSVRKKPSWRKDTIY